MPLTVEEFNFYSEELERKEALLLECPQFDNDVEVLNLTTMLREQIAALKDKLGIKE